MSKNVCSAHNVEFSQDNPYSFSLYEHMDVIKGESTTPGPFYEPEQRDALISQSFKG